MADQNITELPIKTNSGVASTDYMLGIDSAEGYQILVRDVAKYIVENYNGSTILGSAQTVNNAFDTVNSNAYMLNRQNYITSGNLDTFTTCGIYNSSTSGQTANIEGQPTGHPTAGFKLLAEYLGNNTIVKQTIVYNGGETYQRIKSGSSSWSTWQLQPTRAEITELNSNIISGSLNGAKSITITKPNNIPCLVIGTRFRNSTTKPLRVAIVDQWAGINDIITGDSNIDISATTTTVTITNNTTQGAINALFIMSPHVINGT